MSNQFYFVLCSVNILNNNNNMASYSFKFEENTDLCQFSLSTEKEYGVQCVILRDCQNPKEYTTQHCSVVKTLFEERPTYCKDVVFLHVVSPGKAFEKFDQEKYKLVLVARAYFKLLDFFQSEWPMLQKRMESDYQLCKARKDWISLEPGYSFRGASEIVYTNPLDTTNSFALELVVTKRIDNGKTNISLSYTDEKMGSLHLPPQPMVQLAQGRSYLHSIYNYKKGVPSKKSRQS